MNSSESSSYLLTRWLYLRLLGLIYLSAFSSFGTQILGLIGSGGILPAQNFLEQILEHFGSQSYILYPTIAWISCSDQALQLFCNAGSLISLLVIFGLCTGPALVILAILWLSLVTIGGEFTGFQSDGMLVEVTFLTLFFVPWVVAEPPWKDKLPFSRQSSPPAILIWPLRFMLFRLVFASGLVKLLSGDPTWHNLTALCYHWETQPIPTPIAWYAFQLPCWFDQLCTIGMFICELVAPLLIFTTRKLRAVGAILIFSLQALIALTGNYTFLNFLTMTLCIMLLDDGFVRQLLPAHLSARLLKQFESETEKTATRFGRKLNIAAATFLIGIGTIQLAGTCFGFTKIPKALIEVIAPLEQFRLVNSYGMFAVMTTTRPEVIFEGSNDGKTWLPYEFPVKPGDFNRPPAWVEPHMPRLDWRLWFAAMVPFQVDPWVVAFVHRLLEGSPDVLALLAKNPFPDKPPLLIRTRVYDYHFTDYKTREKTGAWWYRTGERPYLPELSLRDPKKKLH